MILIRACHLCGDKKAALIVAPHCHQCESQIKEGLRKGSAVLRKDCPLHPGKKIWCRTFGNVGHKPKSRTCDHHLWQIMGKQVMAKLLADLKKQGEKSKKVGFQYPSPKH